MKDSIEFMDENAINKELKELIQVITNIPKSLPEKPEPPAEGAKKQSDMITKSLTDLRIYIKYLLFDLEATRREKKSLRDQLNDKTGE